MILCAAAGVYVRLRYHFGGQLGNFVHFPRENWGENPEAVYGETTCPNPAIFEGQVQALLIHKINGEGACSQCSLSVR